MQNKVNNVVACCLRSLPDRYRNMKDVASTRSILSLGLSCFKLHRTERTNIDATNGSQHQCPIERWFFTVQTFNVMLLCSEDYIVEPAALKFLVGHGFDFNKQYSGGLSYYRGKEQTSVSVVCECQARWCRVWYFFLWTQMKEYSNTGISLPGHSRKLSKMYSSRVDSHWVQNN